MRRLKFSSVSLLLNVLYKVTIELTFKKFRLHIVAEVRDALLSAY